MSLDHYQLLEVSSTVTSDELKRAYARAIRKHQKDNDKLTQIHAAFATLSDPKARARYDALNQHSGEIENLMEQVRGCFEREEWPNAVKHLKKVCVLAPDIEEAQNQLGLAFCYNEQYDESIKVFEKLTVSSNDVPLYWRNLGAALREKADTLDTGTKRKGELIGRAISAFETAHELEPLNQKDFLEIAQCHKTNGNKQLAVNWAERAIGSTLDYASLEALTFLAWLYIVGNETGSLDSIIKRICAITPSDNDDLQKIVAHRLAELGHELWKLVTQNKYHGLLKHAAILMRNAIRLDAQTDELKSYAQLIINCSDAYDVHEQFSEDNRLYDGFKMIGTYMFAETMGEDVKSWQWNLDDAFNRLDGMGYSDLLSNISYFRSKYPATFWLADNLLNDIEKKIKEAQRTASTQSSSSNTSSSSSSGDCFIATATFGSPDHEIVMLYRQYRDNVLMNSLLGRCFVKVYYKVGPALARLVVQHHILKVTSRRLLVMLSGILRAKI